MESVDTVGTRIMRAREDKFMTQRGLARACYVQQATISRWEIGETQPDTFDLINLARALGVHIADLIPGHPAPDRADLVAIATDLKRLTRAVTTALGAKTPGTTWFADQTPPCEHSQEAHWHLHLRTGAGDHLLGATCFRTRSDALTWGRMHLHELDELTAMPRHRTTESNQ